MKSTPGVARPTDHPTFARASVTFASIVQSSRVDVVASSRARASRLAADATFSGRRDRSHRLPPPSIARVRARASTSDRIASLSRAPARRRFLRSRGVVHRARERVRVRAQVPTLRSRPRPRARDGARVVARAAGAAHGQSRGDRRSARGASRSPRAPGAPPPAAPPPPPPAAPPPPPPPAGARAGGGGAAGAPPRPNIATRERRRASDARARARESERGARANAARLRARTATARERGATRANATRRATVGCGRWTFEFIVERVRRERRA